MVVLDSPAKCLRYTSKKSSFDWNTTLSKSLFFYVIRLFLNEEKFSDFDDFSKTSYPIYKATTVFN